MNKLIEEVEGLSLEMYGLPVAVITHYAGGKNILTFDPTYLALSKNQKSKNQQPTFTLRQLIDPSYLNHVQIRTDKIPPVLSNLLPEGILREWTAKALQCHINDEFSLLAYLGANLPGAIVAKPIQAGNVPVWALEQRLSTEPLQINVKHANSKFSLAGVQMKFSSAYVDGRYHLDQEIAGDTWIIKTPSTIHKGVTLNEYSCMKLAESAGATIPEIRLVELNLLDGLPNIQLPDEHSHYENCAYAIKRFDRGDGGRIHTEDFAQIFGLYPIDKYQKINYEQIGQILFKISDDRLTDIQQLARRLLLNILLGNSDAHLKNWSIIYQDKFLPRLAPFYDVLFTAPYIEQDKLALNMSGTKLWYEISMLHFENWANKAGLPWMVIKPHLLDTLDLARSKWPKLLESLPMLKEHQQTLKTHWSKLHKDFRIEE